MTLLRYFLRDYLDTVSDAIHFCEEGNTKLALKSLKWLYEDIAHLYNDDANYLTEIHDSDYDEIPDSVDETNYDPYTGQDFYE